MRIENIANVINQFSPSPIIFSLYINDLPDACPDIGLQMYADDTVFDVSGKTCDYVADKLTKNLEKVSAWLDASCLTLNTKKTKSVCFSIKKICKTIKANLTCFKMIRKCLTFDCALMFLNSMKLSHLSSYGLTTWSQANQSVIKSIECL